MKEVNKVRVVLLNPKGQIAITKTNSGVYMLPGGKLEEGEQPKDSLIREVQEETGITLKLRNIKGPFYKMEYLGDFIDENTGQMMKKQTNTSFYVGYTTQEIDVTKMKMTPREIARGSKSSFMNISVLRYQIEQGRNETNSARKKKYDTELLQVLDKFREIQREPKERTR